MSNHPTSFKHPENQKLNLHLLKGGEKDKHKGYYYYNAYTYIHVTVCRLSYA